MLFFRCDYDIVHGGNAASFRRWGRINVKKSDKKHPGALSARIHFSEDEKRMPWLPRLLDAYAIADTGVSVAVRQEEKRRKVTLACKKGCGACCLHQKDIPLYPHELVGIYWYVSEKITPPSREILKKRLLTRTGGSSCPFLMDDSCSIHPVRPVGCRQFNVFSAPCAPGEDPYYTRRDDVLVPIQEYTDRAFTAVMPLYNIRKGADVSDAVKLIRSQIMNLKEYDWKKLAAIMENVDSKKR